MFYRKKPALKVLRIIFKIMLMQCFCGISNRQCYSLLTGCYRDRTDVMISGNKWHYGDSLETIASFMSLALKKKTPDEDL